MNNSKLKNLWLFVCPYFTILFAISLLFVSRQEAKIQKRVIVDSAQLAEKTRTQFAHDELKKEVVDGRLGYWQESNQTISKMGDIISKGTYLFAIILIVFNFFGIIAIWRRLRKVEININTSE
jgi:hypothetical protein